MVGRGALVVPVFAVLVSVWLFYPEWSDGAAAAVSSRLASLVGAKEPAATEEEPLNPYMWWSPLSAEEREAELVRECEQREAEYRTELAAEPDSWQVQAKLAISLLETNGSRVQPRPERLAEGRAFAEAAMRAKPKNWRTQLARVSLLLADFSDTKTEEASRLAEELVKERQNRHTNLAMGRAFLVDGCALMCEVRRTQHRIDLDPPGAVYPEGKEPNKRAQSYMQTAYKRLTDAGKRLHAAYDAELFEKDPSVYGAGAASARVSEQTLLMSGFGPYTPLLWIENLKGGIHPTTLFRAGGCDDFVGRKLGGKTCPTEEPPKQKKKMRKKSAAEK